MIKSTSYDQFEILQWILDLRKVDRFEVDLTYGRGKFYTKIPQPHLKFDRYPTEVGIVPADASRIPLADSSVGSVVFDPPFLATTGKSLPKKGPIRSGPGSNAITRSYGRFDSEKALFSFYREALWEIHRILSTKGFCVFKIQDKTSSGKQYWSHVWAANEAEKIGFYCKDLFILLAKSRLTPAWQLANQQHARKFHSYFWLLEKK